ncbi:hypothetical protein JYK02_17085 [Corallococcus macrosporus]|uniref:Type 4 fimbrial biogenesis protein PilX N-terminal domain-containing protein n=1 Tax=Corallococcus macrosporus TaxID=35 RepID=A0ABS3DEJ6_9BACT|nr:hypothetical protein [Corallococcus macrosporus]MBN8229226.1 hypothetical protein [Corallococcus macrosporus]
MVRRPTLRRRSRGFTLLLALGVVAVVTMAVMLSYSVVGREADTQADTRRQKQAFFAAEAGLAEGREAVRLMMTGVGVASTLKLQDYVGTPVTDVPDLASANPRWYELLPGTAPGKWNDYRILTTNLDTTEVPAGVDYPEQRYVRYRVFVRDDLDGDNDPDTDSNKQLWILAVGEVTSANGRPTRSVVQALVTNTTGESIFTPGCITKGCGPDMTYNNPTDQKAPETTVITIP